MKIKRKRKKKRKNEMTLIKTCKEGEDKLHKSCLNWEDNHTRREIS